ncbi:MAG: putative zinc-binding peptidase [Aliidongia sp.]
MKLFQCQHCGQLVYFENVRCETCGHRLGFLPELMTLSALEPEGETWHALVGEATARYRFCANAEFDACNWLVPDGGAEAFCLACRHNQMIPDMTVPENLPNWRKLEAAKHRLFYSVLRLKLPLANRADDPEHGLAFEFLAVAPDVPKVMTGHDNGLITVALTEADDVERERMRQQMGETYRTLLGHFRHELGHHYWDLLVRDGGRLDAFRALFGDESAGYAEALKRNYEQGPPPDWREQFVSSYASSHPWEDFAETWAHYLHIVDTLEMGFAFGLEIRPRAAGAGTLQGSIGFDPYRGGSIERLVEAWLPLVFAVNSLNRAMGLPDLYPFVLTPPVIAKLGFVHRLVHDQM